jgi:hypothetical protein
MEYVCLSALASRRRVRLRARVPVHTTACVVSAREIYPAH